MVEVTVDLRSCYLAIARLADVDGTAFRAFLAAKQEIEEANPAEATDHVRVINPSKLLGF